jgi:hypothetical protein
MNIGISEVKLGDDVILVPFGRGNKHAIFNRPVNLVARHAQKQVIPFFIEKDGGALWCHGWKLALIGFEIRISTQNS